MGTRIIRNTPFEPLTMFLWGIWEGEQERQKKK